MVGSDKVKNQKYICCFCGEDITSNEIDITGIIVVSNWDKGSERQQEQQLFCHINCLKERLSKNIPLYIADLID